jgi:hypothetical protein
MTRHPSNRNGHLCNFEGFAPISRSTEELIRHATAWRDGTAPPSGNPPTQVHSTKSLGLVRYRLNSLELAAAFRAMGDRHTDFHDEAFYVSWTARFGVIDRESGQPIALLWIINDPNHADGFEIADISISDSVSVERTDMVEILNELDVPPARDNGVANRIADRFDLWYAEESWEIREPQNLLSFRFSRMCFDTNPPLEDVVSVFVEIDPDHPLDGRGNETVAYANLQHHRDLAWERFAEMDSAARTGFSSWMEKGNPQVIKVTGASLDAVLGQTTPDRPSVARANRR